MYTFMVSVGVVECDGCFDCVETPYVKTTKQKLKPKVVPVLKV